MNELLQRYPFRQVMPFVLDGWDYSLIFTGNHSFKRFLGRPAMLGDWKVKSPQLNRAVGVEDAAGGFFKVLVLKVRT